MRIHSTLNQKNWFLLLLGGFTFWLLPKKTAPQVVIEANQIDTIFYVVENRILLNVKELPDSLLRVEPSVGELLRSNYQSGLYFWTICAIDRSEAKLRIFEKSKNELVSERVFRLKELPFPMPKFVHYKYAHRFLTSNLFAPSGADGPTRGIALEMAQDELFNFRILTVQFDVCRLTPKLDSIRIINTGGSFEPQTRDLIEKADSGDTIIFENIKYKNGCDPRVHALPDRLVFTIQ